MPTLSPHLFNKIPILFLTYYVLLLTSGYSKANPVIIRRDIEPDSNDLTGQSVSNDLSRPAYPFKTNFSHHRVLTAKNVPIIPLNIPKELSAKYSR